MTNEQATNLWKLLEGLEKLVSMHKNALENMGVDFRGILAECCILSNSSRDVIEYNSMCRVQYNRVIDEITHLKKLLGLMAATIVSLT